ncbi:spastic paraplegia 21 [Pelomyxa schiedti]|nr:spastic paraplegia 21 [Pelomyxa schiedti]
MLTAVDPEDKPVTSAPAATATSSTTPATATTTPTTSATTTSAAATTESSTTTASSSVSAQESRARAAAAAARSILEDPEWRNFRSWVAMHKVVVDHLTGTGGGYERTWKYFDHGPRDLNGISIIPLVCLAPLGGTADLFFRQILRLSARGIRVIAVQAPYYSTHRDWADGLDYVLDKIAVPRCHLFGVGLGGFLAQIFWEYHPMKVASMVLCNTFTSNAIFASSASKTYSFMPDFLLKRIVLSKMPDGVFEAGIADSIDLAVDGLEKLDRNEIAGQMTLNYSTHFIPKYPPVELVTLITVPDDSYNVVQALPEETTTFRDAKVAHLKNGGPWAFVSRADEINILLQVHVRNHTPSIVDPSQSPPPTTASSS